MSSFQAKIGWKKRRKRENKNYCFVPFLPDRLENIPKKQQKIHKSKKYPYGINSGQNMVGKC